MFDKFKQLGELKKMRDQAMQIQRELDGEVIEVEKNGVRIKISLAQKIRELESNGKSDDDIREAVNEALKESQEKAAKKMQSLAGLEGLKGMLGGQ